MCAISGVFDLPIDQETLTHMLDTMRRRGPDGEGIYSREQFAMLHTRLAIVDPQGGAQPMHTAWEGETYTIIYNGELYNTEEIRLQLEKNGHYFLGRSDTEVVLHAFAHWGEACLQQLNGIFAFAVWQHKARRLFLARDRIGVKPLFYSCLNGGLIFASEIKTILAYPQILPQLDAEGAAQLILLGPGRLPGSGVFQNIFELEPGCCAVYREGKLRVRRYWKLQDGLHSDTLEQTIEKVRFLVLDSIRRQMVSDVPLGTFLSGGLDSSIISAVCAKELEERGQILQTFSVDYKNNELYFSPEKFQPESDGEYIHIMLEYMGAQNRRKVIGTEELLEALEPSTDARDLPGMADVDFSLLAFCKDVRRDVKMVLSGECADEIFGGYPWYRDPKIRAMDGFPWAQNTIVRCGLMSEALSNRINGQDFITDAYRQTCRESDICPENTDTQRRMKEMINLNFRWFMQTLLDRKDRMSMYSGLEVRVPFCDYRIAQYLYTVPWEMKELEGREKGLLRKAMEGMIPDRVLYRKKSPYPKTYDPKYEQLVRSRLEEILRSPDSKLFALVSKASVEKIMEYESPWPWYGQLMRRPQTMAYLLQIEYWLKQYRVELCF